MMEILVHEQRSSDGNQQWQSPTSWLDYQGEFSGVHWAAAHQKSNMCRFAISQHLNLDVRDVKGMSPLAHAIRAGHEEACRLLLESGKVDVNSVNSTQITPLFHAVKFGSPSQVQHLLAAPQINVQHRDRSGRTALTEAVMLGAVDIFRDLLKDQRLDPEAIDTRGRTSLSHAAELDRVAIVILLLLCDRVDVDSQDSQGRTPLSYAAECGNLRITRFLLRTSNVDKNTPDSDGRTPLSYAVEGGALMVVSYMLTEHGVAVDAKDNSGRTPLHYAAQRRNEEILKVLLENHADVNAKDMDGRTPLSYIPLSSLEQAMTNYEPPEGECIKPGICAKLLRSRDASMIDTPDICGRTPLCYAAHCNDVATVCVLLNNHNVDTTFIDLESDHDESSERWSRPIHKVVADYRAGSIPSSTQSIWMFPERDMQFYLWWAVIKPGQLDIDQHYGLIRSLVPDERLVKWRLEDGWDSLCAFLPTRERCSGSCKLNAVSDKSALNACNNATPPPDTPQASLPSLNQPPPPPSTSTRTDQDPSDPKTTSHYSSPKSSPQQSPH
jgi:ankyrin repeat protein